MLGVYCQQDGDRANWTWQSPAQAWRKPLLLSNTCLMLLGSGYNQRPVLFLHTGVKISLADQETEANGAGKGMAETWCLGEK